MSRFSESISCHLRLLASMVLAKKRFKMRKRYFEPRHSNNWISMSTEKFVRNLQKKHSEEIKKFAELQEILDQLQGKGKQITNVYVTSNL